MPDAPHQVRRLRWDVRVPTAEAALEFRRALRDRLEPELIEALGRAFDRLGVGETTIRVPRLSARIRLVDGVDPIADLADQVEDQLAEMLSRRIEEGISVDPDGPSAPGVDRAEPLRRYLESGRVAWPLAGLGREAIVRTLREAVASLAADWTALGRMLGDSWHARVAAAARLLPLLEPGTRDALLRRGDLGETSPLRDDLRAAVASGATPVADRLRAEAVLLALRPVDEAPERFADVVASLPTAMRSAVATAPGEPDPAGGLATAKGPPPGPRALDSDRSRDVGASRGIVPDAPVAAEADDDGTAPSESGGLTDGEAAWLSATATALDHSGVEDHQADDAGMVLLHPYLPRLFEAVGLLDPRGRRLDEGSLPRAGALLHWLASGRDEILEFELTVARVLLGMDLNEPLPFSAGLLGAAERAEADALLVAAIGHWPALKGTTVAGFRASFLGRKGLLREAEDGWRLRVATASFDVLLGMLPWGFHAVKLPWMKRPLFTEWPMP